MTPAAGPGGAAAPPPLDQYDDDGNPLPPPDPSIDRVSGIDWERVRQQGGAAAAAAAGAPPPAAAETRVDTGREKWWQRRFQAVFLPNVRFSDGGVGFLQLDCSLVEGK